MEKFVDRAWFRRNFALDTSTGAITIDTVLGAGTYPYQVTVTDVNGVSVTQTITVTVCGGAAGGVGGGGGGVPGVPPGVDLGRRRRR